MSVACGFDNSLKVRYNTYGMSQKPLLSIVTPVYNEEKNVGLFYTHIRKILQPLPYQFELIYVDDGSRDGSARAMKSLKNQGNLTVRPLRLSRNFGKEIAVTAGLHEAKGDAVIVLDSDLQHPVDKIPEFIAKWQDGADIVIGVRTESGKDSIVKDLGSKVFYRIINRISETDIIPHATDFRLLDRHVVNEFVRFTERHRITRGLIDWLGFDREIVYFEANEREHGEASYSLKRLVGLAVTSFISHSLFPLRIAGYFGGILTIVSGVVGAFVLVEHVILDDVLGLAISGTAMITIALLFVCGVILSSLGLISMYLALMHAETTNRPLYVLRREGE